MGRVRIAEWQMPPNHNLMPTLAAHSPPSMVTMHRCKSCTIQTFPLMEVWIFFNKPFFYFNSPQALPPQNQSLLSQRNNLLEETLVVAEQLSPRREATIHSELTREANVHLERLNLVKTVPEEEDEEEEEEVLFT